MLYITISLSLLLVGAAHADSLNCRLVGHCDTPGGAYGVAVAGSYACVADGNAGLRVISVADPAHPLEVGYCNTPGTAHGVAVAGSYVYVADDSEGLQIIQFYGGGVEETPTAEVRATRYGPTIARGVLHRPASSVRRGALSALLDAAGRKVLELRPGANDVSGLAPGVYFVREAQAQAQAVQKVIITK